MQSLGLISSVVVGQLLCMTSCPVFGDCDCNTAQQMSVGVTTYLLASLLSCPLPRHYCYHSTTTFLPLSPPTMPSLPLLLLRLLLFLRVTMVLLVPWFCCLLISSSLWALHENAGRQSADRNAVSQVHAAVVSVPSKCTSWPLTTVLSDRTSKVWHIARKLWRPAVRSNHAPCHISGMH